MTKKFKYEIFAILIANIKKTLASKKHTNSATKVLAKYYKNLKAFSQIKANKLLKYQLYNFKIKLESEKQLLFDLLYEIFWNKLKYL